MAGRNVERVEIVKARFDLRAVFDRITHRDKHVLDALANKGDRMKMPLSRTCARQGYVNLLAFERASFRLARELFGQASDFRFDSRADLVHLTTELCAFLRG